MATITTTLLTNTAVDMADDNLVTFDRNLTATGAQFSWLAGEGAFNAVYLHGRGFTYSGSGDGRELSGGAISRIVLEVNNNGPETSGDLSITGTGGLDVTRIKKGDAQSFWGEVLKGDDTFNLFGLNRADVGPFISTIFGDDLRCVSVTSEKVDQGGNDRIFGANNEMRIYGDVLTVAGNPGGDFFIPAIYTGGDDTISAAAGNRRNVLAGDARQVLDFGEVNGGDDTIDASRNTDVGTEIVGDVENVETDGLVRGGDDTLTLSRNGSGAGDVHDMSGANAFVFGGADTIDGRLLVAAGDVFVMTSTATNSRVVGGNDRIVGGLFQDRISGDVLLRNSEANTVTGGADLIFGGDGDDLLFGEVAAGFTGNVIGGNDRIFGGAGRDRLAGQSGNDGLTGGSGADSLDGGSGNDLAAYDTSAKGVTVNLLTGFGQGGDAEGDTLANIERLLGSDFVDTLVGNANDNRLAGGAGGDMLIGRAGHDILLGEGGADRFVFSTLAESAVGAQRDIISDFSKAQLDKINVAAIDASASAAGNNAFTVFIGNAAFSAEGQIRAFQAGTSTVIEFNASGAAGADMQVQLGNFTASTLALTDFVT